MQTKKTIQKLVYFVLPIVLGIISILFNGKWIFSKFGTIAFLTLTFNLYLKPLSILFRNKIFNFFMGYRRELGITSFWFYLFHSGGFFLLYGLSPSNFLNTNSHLFWAGLAASGMWLLGLTSNDISVRKLGRNWKRLHRLAYPLFFFALIHSSLAEAEPHKILILGLPYIVLKVLEFRKIPFRW